MVVFHHLKLNMRLVETTLCPMIYAPALVVVRQAVITDNLSVDVLSDSAVADFSRVVLVPRIVVDVLPKVCHYLGIVGVIV